jgi:hypothetical protein
MDDAAVAGERQPAMNERRSRDVAAEPLEPGRLAGTAPDRGVQGVARDVGAEHLVRQVGRWRRGRIAEQGGALPDAWAVWDDALGRGGVVQLLLAGLGVVDRDLPVVGEVAAAA